MEDLKNTVNDTINNLKDKVDAIISKLHIHGIHVDEPKDQPDMADNKEE